MNYSELLDNHLTPKPNAPLVLDLFAGCGGLALGFESQGFETRGYEMDEVCCITYNQNLRGECIRQILTSESDFPQAKVIIGGPPCQPFSVIGNQNGFRDRRDGFPIFLSAIKRVNPDIFLFENVRGLVYRSKPYFDFILCELKSLGYVVSFQLMNAVNFGVPQNRERVIVVGHRGEFDFPHEMDTRITAGEALGELATMAPAESRFLTKSMDEYIARYERASQCIRPRDLHLDAPARTLTCRNLAGATSDMQRVRLPDGRRRRILLREAARLQSFPDWFHFSGTETEQFNQIGNAVPPMFAFHLAGAIREYLETSVRFNSGEIAYRNLPTQLELKFGRDPQEVFMRTFIKVSKKKPVERVINEALYILSSLGIPFDGLGNRRLEKIAMAFLAVCDVKRPGQWHQAKDATSGRFLTTRQIIEYINQNFQEQISSGSYDDIRRKDLKMAVTDGVVLRSANDPNAATNNPTRGYALNPDFAGVVSSFGSDNWNQDVEDFIGGRLTLDQRLSDERTMSQVPVELPSGITLQFSRGKHNLLQKAIIEEFLPRYGEGAEVLYVGDAADKFLHMTKPKLETLKFFELSHDELPDVVAYADEKNWLYLIEAVHSSGPISKLRHEELRQLTKECTAEIVYVTAFLDRQTFRKFSPDISWETEVWIAEAPDHIIHFDGKRFLGPYESKR